MDSDFINTRELHERIIAEIPSLHAGEKMTRGAHLEAEVAELYASITEKNENESSPDDGVPPRNEGGDKVSYDELVEKLAKRDAELEDYKSLCETMSKINAVLIDRCARDASSIKEMENIIREYQGIVDLFSERIRTCEREHSTGNSSNVGTSLDDLAFDAIAVLPGSGNTATGAPTEEVD